MPQIKRPQNIPFTLSIGPRRCATSWIYRYLQSRGDVCLPKGVKETRYFDRHYSRGRHFYDSHFKPKKRHRVMAEIGTTFFHEDNAPQRVYDYFDGRVRLLCPLRHPIMRAYSQYYHMVRYGQVNSNLQDACSDHPYILDSSRYTKHIQRWADVFGMDAIQFLFKEDLETDSSSFTQDLCQALDIPFTHIAKAALPRYNATAQSNHPHIARTAQRYSDILRQHRLYAPINAAKKLGLKRVIFGRETVKVQPLHIPPADLAFLNAHLSDEIQKLESLIDPLPQWKLDRFTLAG